ncbi:ATP-dependent Clp protease proteolytic subunit 6, chloroplastic-like isoform X2 [Castanea sativa]|uniref:ATP-dependent Clp protease proteolytic subunit 6, chloroplastic-like isoform X2 n=1 Tax=Castanea sativa TaxID=21020 RepID=UPI003F64FD54
MVASAISVPLSFSIASRSRTSSIPLFSRRNSTRSIVSALPGLSSKTCWLPSKHEEKDFPGTSTSYDAIEARKGNPPVMPAVMTPGGPLDLSSVLFRNRIIFIGQPVNSQVYLNCPGGSTYSVLAIYDCMSWIKPKVGTVCFGVAVSQGALLLAGGEKGMRYAMPNARIMIHQPQSGCGV